MSEEDKKPDGEVEEEKPITAGYRPLWGRSGMLSLFYAAILFPLGLIGLFLLSPMFIFLLILCFGLFVAGATMVELEQREPRVPDHEWQKVAEDPKEE